VTRDDLEDGGAAHFAKTVECIREINPRISIEILTPDFQGSEDALRAAVASRPDIFNHNLETVPRLYPSVRPDADYERSLRFLKRIKERDRDILTKSGIMLGLGETYGEVMDLMGDLRQADCDIVTVGQYLMPSKESVEVKEYVPPELFEKYKEDIENMGFLHVFSGPFVRSSYNAESVIEQSH